MAQSCKPEVDDLNQAAELLSSAQVIQAEGTIYMVLEYGDIDLARLLAKHEKAHREGGSDELDENFIRLYWQQMLQVGSLQCLVAPWPTVPELSSQSASPALLCWERTWSRTGS